MTECSADVHHVPKFSIFHKFWLTFMILASLAGYVFDFGSDVLMAIVVGSRTRRIVDHLQTPYKDAGGNRGQNVENRMLKVKTRKS
jgi:hypothetical protein